MATDTAKIVEYLQARKKEGKSASDATGQMFMGIFKPGSPLNPAFPLPPEDLAASIKQVYQVSDDELATILKNSYPDLSDIQLRNAILSASPLEVTVKANIPWVDTGLNLTGDVEATVTYVSGQWASNSTWGYVGAEGYGHLICGGDGVVPKAPFCALIGRVGNGKPFIVGKSKTIPKTEKGKLYLANNDIPSGYGDNLGSLVVKITRKA